MILYSYHMLSIAVLNKILDNCLYMGYKPTSNSEPLVRPKNRPGAKVLTILKNHKLAKCLHISKTIYIIIFQFLWIKNVFLCKIGSWMWPHPTPQDFYFNEFESTLPKVAFTKVTDFLDKWFCKRFFSLYSYVKNLSPSLSLLWPHLTPRGSWFEQTWIYLVLTWGCFHISFIFPSY